MTDILFAQLPLQGAASLEPTGNIPLAGANITSAADLGREAILDQDIVDTLGDRALIEKTVEISPSILCLTLYSWNVERSLYISERVREQLPGITVIGGGPEVFPDNSWLLKDGRLDLAVCGEAEHFAPTLLKSVLSGGFKKSEKTVLIQAPTPEFPPGHFPNPYLSGYLDPSLGDSVYVETVRGCPNLCSYCSYRRSSPYPRYLPAKNAVGLVERLAEAGADEIVFLDPTFNQRPDFSELLDGLSGIGIECFAEIRSEGINRETAEKIFSAGFKKVEVGLQSFNSRVLENNGRFADPREVIRGCENLLAAGVIPVIDLILGLPGDDLNDFLIGATTLKEKGLAEEVQVFYLSMLPGTEIRKVSEELGMDYMSRPPYYVTSVSGAGFDAMDEVREGIADILGYDLDIAPRPLLFENWPGTEFFDLDREPVFHGSPPSFRHGSIVFSGENLWENRDKIKKLIKRRTDNDPFCVLDVVLNPAKSFPANLVDFLRQIDKPIDYTGRTARILGHDGNLRISTLLTENPGHFSPGWIEQLSRLCPVVIDVREADETAVQLVHSGIGIRLPHRFINLTGLARRFRNPELVFFKSMELEKLWTEAVLQL